MTLTFKLVQAREQTRLPCRKAGGELLCPFRGWGELGPRLTQCGLGRGLLPYQVASSSIQPFGYNRHGPKTGDVHLLGGLELGPHLTQCRWAEAYLRTKWHLDPSSRLATIGMGRKLGDPPPFGGGGAASPPNTMSLKLRLNSLPSGILINPAI